MMIRRPKRPTQRKPDATTAMRLSALGPGWESEAMFHPSRNWRFDLAHEAGLVAIEIDGGAFSRGRHTRGAGFVEDQAKRNAATLLGWAVLHCTPRDFFALIDDAQRLSRARAAVTARVGNVYRPMLCGGRV
jgi:hypothetical protein